MEGSQYPHSSPGLLMKEEPVRSSGAPPPPSHEAIGGATEKRRAVGKYEKGRDEGRYVSPPSRDSDTGKTIAAAAPPPAAGSMESEGIGQDTIGKGDRVREQFTSFTPSAPPTPNRAIGCFVNGTAASAAPQPGFKDMRSAVGEEKPADGPKEGESSDISGGENIRRLAPSSTPPPPSSIPVLDVNFTL